MDQESEEWTTNNFGTSKGDRETIEQEQTENTEFPLSPLSTLWAQFRMAPGRIRRETSSVNFGELKLKSERMERSLKTETEETEIDQAPGSSPVPVPALLSPLTPVL